MTGRLPPLTGTIRQSDALALKERMSAKLAAGNVVIEAEALEGVELGPLQVLLSAALEARRQGLSCTLSDAALPAVERSLAAVRLPPADRFFTMPLSREPECSA